MTPEVKLEDTDLKSPPVPDAPHAITEPSFFNAANYKLI